MLVKNKGYPKGERIFKMEVFLIMKKKFFAVAMATTMALSTAVTAMAVDVKDTISGDLTVTTFFNEKTDAVTLKSGDSYTFKFNDKTNGDKNYENYVMAVTGAIGDAYTGAEQEVAIFRADAWGWGGGMSDFVAPDGTGNKLEFQSDANFDAWVSEMQAGQDCTVTISRTGDKLDYTAKIGSYTISTSATSGKALPETCYVFFTGEKCALTGFTTTKNGGDAATTPAVDTKKGDTATPAAAPADKKDNATTAAAADKKDNKATTKATTKTSPKTGDVAPIAALGAVAVVACAGVVVSRKKVTE